AALRPASVIYPLALLPDLLHPAAGPSRTAVRPSERRSVLGRAAGCRQAECCVMRIITWMLTKMLVLRFLVILFGITSFVIMLDLIAYADDVLKVHDNDFWSLGHYVVLRAPSVAAQFVSISTLLAALLMLTDASRHSELVAIWSSGVSHFRI